MAAGQADDGRAVRRAGHRHGQVLDEGQERVSHRPVAVDEIEHLVEEHQHRLSGRRDHASERFGAGGGRRRVRAEKLHALIARKLTGYVDPGGFPSVLRVPCVADEDRSLRGGKRAEPGLVQHAADVVELRHRLARRREVVQGGQRVRLAAPKLRHQRQHRRRVRRLPGETPEHHAGVVAQRARETRAGEERMRIAVVGRRRAGDDLFQGDGELVRVERTALADFFARERDLVPRFERHLSCAPRTCPPVQPYCTGGWAIRIRPPRMVTTARASSARRYR